MTTATTLLESLQEASSTLPGRSMHRLLSPVDITDYQPPTTGYREAAVMVLLYPKDKVWHTVYIKRTANDPRDKHAGQISLPGGKAESYDTTPAHTAAREVHEEIGVRQEHIHIINPLSDLYVSPSNFMVYPYIGIIDYTPVFVPQVSEVDGIVESSLSYLQQMPILTKTLDVRGSNRRRIPYYNLHGHTLWGATSMITAEFVAILAKVDL